MPSTYGIGLSYNHINKLEINADYYHAGWSKASFLGKMERHGYGSGEDCQQDLNISPMQLQSEVI